MGFIELCEMGFFECFYNFSNLYVSVPMYFCVLIGIISQNDFFKKYNKGKKRYLLIFVCIAGIFLSECIWLIITGWDRLAVVVVYGFIICILIGALIRVLIEFIKIKNH